MNRGGCTIPRIYLTPSEIDELPLGFALANQISQLAPGVVDKLLARASQRCDSYTEKRLQSTGTTTLSQTANATTTSIMVNSTLTIDNLAEQAAIIDVGNSNQETMLIQPGGVTVSSWQSPYPGIIQLASPLQFTHASGAPVQYAYKEVNEARNSSIGDPFAEALQSQAAQLALAHLPPIHVGLTRITWLNNYPIQTVYLVEHAYSFTTEYNVVFDSANPAYTGGIIVEPTAGTYRFRLGTVVVPQGYTRTTYIGGYSSVPDDIKVATSYYVADEFQRLSNPFSANDMSQGKRRQSYKMENGKTPSVQIAEDILKRYKRSV